MFRYRAFSLSVTSDVALPSFQSDHGQGPPDIDVTFAVDSGAEMVSPGEHPVTTAECSGDTVFLAASWQGHHARFVCTNKLGRVRISYWPETELRNTVTYFCGPVLRLLITCRGVLGLHSGGVTSDGLAVLVAGAQGAGKSTLLAALSRLGAKIFSDDFAVLEDTGGEWVAHTGALELKLTASSLEASGLQSHALARAQWDFADAMPPLGERQKVIVGISGETLPATRALNAIFVLEERSGTETRVVQLKAARALALLATHLPPLPKEVSHLRNPRITAAKLSRLVSAVPFYTVSQPHDLSILTRTARAVLNTAAASVLS